MTSSLLYHTVLIILFRPIMCSNRENLDLAKRAGNICAENTTIIHEFFLLYGRTFKSALLAS